MTKPRNITNCSLNINVSVHLKMDKKCSIPLYFTKLDAFREEFEQVLISHPMLQLVLLTWSYIMVVSQNPGSVPENWKPTSEENLEAGISTSLSDYMVLDSSASTSLDVPESRQALGYCRFCRNGKPPRCHHCSVCKLFIAFSWT